VWIRGKPLRVMKDAFFLNSSTKCIHVTRAKVSLERFIAKTELWFNYLKWIVGLLRLIWEALSTSSESQPELCAHCTQRKIFDHEKWFILNLDIFHLFKNFSPSFSSMHLFLEHCVVYCSFEVKKEIRHLIWLNNIPSASNLYTRNHLPRRTQKKK